MKCLNCGNDFEGDINKVYCSKSCGEKGPSIKIKEIVNIMNDVGITYTEYRRRRVEFIKERA